MSPTERNGNGVVQVEGTVGPYGVNLRIKGLEHIVPRDLYASAVAGGELSEHVRMDTPKQRQSFADRVFKLADVMLRRRRAQ